MGSKTVFDTMTYKILDICEKVKDPHSQYVRTYHCLEEIYNLAKTKYNHPLEPTNTTEPKTYTE